MLCPSCAPLSHPSACAPLAWGAATSHTHPAASRRCLCTARAARGPADPGPFSERDRRALREAAEVLQEAQELAEQQTRAQLASALTLTAAASSGSSSGGAPPGLPEPSSDAALLAFWSEQGLSARQAEALLRTLPRLNTAHLAQRLAGLERVLPEADVAGLVAAEPELLLADTGRLVSNLIALLSALEGRDVVGMALARPRLLLLDDMPDRLRRIIAKLVALHPSRSEAVVGGIIAENPELLLRMDFYLGDDVRLLDDLPLELQNMFVLGDESGLGFLHQYWRARRGEAAGGSFGRTEAGAEGA